MKKIICLIDSLGPGGAQRQLVGLSTLLKDIGYDVTVVCYHDNTFYINKLRHSGVRYVFLENAKNSISRVWKVAHYIRKTKPDIVISYLETPSICASLSRLINHKFRLIVSERNTTQHTGFNERIRFNLFRVADSIVPNSYSQELYIVNTFKFLSKKVVTIPNYVDLDYFVVPGNRSRREVPEIVIAASIWPSKNTLGFIDAVYALKKNHKFHISWYGLNEAHKEYCELCIEKIKRLDVSDYVELKEKTSEIRSKYQDADYFCLPSLYEGTPNVICEAMACGLPVACSDVCDNNRYVQEGENGFLFNPRDRESMAEALNRMLSLSDSDYNAYCCKSRERAEALLSKEKFLESYIKLVEQ